MGRDREVDEVKTLPEDDDGPIPLEPVNLLAGIGSGLELETDDLTPGIAGNAESEPAYITVDEVGRMLRMNEATIRRLIRTAVIRPVMIDGKIRIPRQQIEAYRSSVHRGTSDKPGE
jgi:excisionase family DNA binding protein